VTVPLQNITAPPLTTQFPAASGLNQSQVTFPWQQWFQSLVTSIQAALANIASNAITPSTQAGLAGLDLNSQDSGFLVEVTDYNHVLEWNGTGFEWGPGENGSGYISAFLSAPTSIGWHICDGSVVSQLNSDGSLKPVTLPNYTTASYLKLAVTVNAGPNLPNGQSQTLSAGTPSGTNAGNTSGVESADHDVQSGAGATVAASNHTHNVAGQVFTGISLPPHSHGPGTLDLQNTQLLAYFRQ
jgi:hypothetical protein